MPAVSVAVSEKPSPPAAVIAPVTDASCANCGASVREKYCGQCGQKNFDVRQSTWRFFKEIGEDWLHVDSKLIRTLASLVLHPGELTEQYLAGRRKRFIKPFKVYVIASVAFFSSAALHSSPTNVHVNDGHAHAGITIGTAPGSRKPGEPGRRSSLEKKIDTLVEQDPLAVRRLVQTALFQDTPRAMFLLVPLFALLLKLLYVRTRRFYVEHFIFALHVHAFAFGGFFLATFNDSAEVLLAVLGVVMLYAYAAMRRIYRQAGWLTALKAATVMSVYLMVVGCSVGAVIFARLYFA